MGGIGISNTRGVLGRLAVLCSRPKISEDLEPEYVHSDQLRGRGGLGIQHRWCIASGCVPGVCAKRDGSDPRLF